jgi:HEPN domain-containing protein
LHFGYILRVKERIFQNHWNQARHTLRSAQADCDNGFFDWASFKAQQAAELALKGLLRSTDEYVTGHSVWALLEKAGASYSVSEGILHCARTLDTYYIPARYPDAYPDGAPYEFFDAAKAQSAIACAKTILKFVMLHGGTGDEQEG